MSIFLCMINLDGSAIDDSCKEMLISTIASDTNQHITFEYSDDNVFVISYDAGAFKCPAVIEDDIGFTLAVGDPIIRSSANKNRLDDTQNIHESFRLGNSESLHKARGVFAGVHYNRNDKFLRIFSDKLGVRPVFYYLDQNILLFSSVFLYFERLSFLSLTEDIEGLAEDVAFISLADRTPYNNIKRILPAELLEVKNGQFSRRCYWDWGRLSGKSYISSISEPVQSAYNAFDEAVSLRLGDEKNAIAFLSGGLDSRCITALVKRKVGGLNTFNFATEQSQDGVLAQLYAEKLHSNHYETKEKKRSFSNLSQSIADASKHVFESSVNSPKYPHLVWSGDGGSVSAGFVYLNKEIILLLNENKVEEAVECFLSSNNIGLPFRFFSAAYKDSMKSLLKNNICKELAALKNVETDRKLYLFLMFNDQRRHLHLHFETIGKHKTEFLLPFFDANFLRIMFSISMEDGLYHGFYMKWFEKFPVFASETPWQTYPKHEQCPLKMPENLSYQWDDGKQLIDESTRGVEVDKLIMMVIRKPKMSQYVNRFKVVTALLLFRLNIRDYSFLMPFLEKLNRYVK
ncbi:MAG TPA: hypothetical protein ENI76_08190 [Ignavibacteria bacterium]|nr:hypothetical protein [Ignavibacteria bacterium]